jgi:beta-glucanase (GH16 family)
MNAPFLPIIALVATASMGYSADAQRPLIDLAAAGADAQFKPSSNQVSVAGAQGAPGAVVTIQPGKEGYPGITLSPPEGKWDLSDFGHIEARIANLSDKPISISLAVDNKPDGSQRNTESTSVKPGETGSVKVIFGYGYNKKPSYALNPAEVQRLLFFTTETKAARSFRIESIHAGGPAGEKPPFDPSTVRVKPEKGVLFDGAAKIDAEKQLVAKDGANASVVGGHIEVTVPQNKNGTVTFSPAAGRWDLRQFLQVRVKVKNTGQVAITPTATLKSNKGSGERFSAAAPIAPGASGEVVASFIPTVPWRGITGSVKTNWDGEKGTGTKLGSEAVGGVTITAEPSSGNRSFVIESILADVPPAKAMPEWLGKRPPVEGEWVQTFDEEFNGDKIDESKWNIYTENFWDKKTHFSKDNVIVADGMATLRYEKKRGFHNDDPKQTLALTNPKVSESDYASGFLDTYGKWVQRYGYFEARMKLPKAEGLWPAMWLMPDRGVASGPQWKRSSTSNGVMEFLSGWGPYRYNIAWHWDGYGKEHQQTGTEQTYFLPDKDGFLTAGVLWLPGQSVYYVNGQEVSRWETPRMSTVQSELMFTHVSGGWANTPLEESALPADFVIDYVRAWQRKDLASEVDGKQPQAAAK